ncbi:hypothetical protein V5F34_00645 [Xanthobacter autotrophicus]
MTVLIEAIAQQNSGFPGCPGQPRMTAEASLPQKRYFANCEYKL